MRTRFDRFLRHSTVLSHNDGLGRAFSVTRETWRLQDDPKAVRPRRETLVVGKTASEAADVARVAAEAYSEHGFHKPSGAWWGSDGELFHRFVVHARRRRGLTAVLLTSAVAGLGIALVHRSTRRK
jgi:hypothetical protein